MDPTKLARLQALTGEKDIIEATAQLDINAVSDQQRQPTTSYIYEGTDEEETDNEIITSRAVGVQSTSARYLETRSIPKPHSSQNLAAGSQRAFAEFDDYKIGQLCAEDTEFCSLAAVKKYPYTFVGVGNRQRVAENFFDKNQLMNNNTWDVFYIHEKVAGYSDTHILVPTQQFRCFLASINHNLGTQLTIPQGANGAFEVVFVQDVGTPCPRYLGRSSKGEDLQSLKDNMPPRTYKLKGEKETSKPSDRSLEAFRKHIELLQNAQKAKKKAAAEKKRADRIAEKQEWSHSLKRVQRYLGLRQTRTPFQANNFITELPQTVFNADVQAPFIFEQDVVFVCVDVEAWERDHNIITEIGISTLDTRDLAGIAPGKDGEHWMKLIRARHFRIEEYKNLHNHEFVSGCADKFEKEFGESEFVKLANAPTIVASCFKYPFSKVGECPQPDSAKRNIILVGHDTKQDIAYLRKVGYDVYNLSNLMEEVDTATMWRYLTRDTNPRALGHILAELGIIAWNLHNAGNDAAYTLQAMIGIGIKAIVDKQKGREVLEAAKDKRVSLATKEAEATALEHEAEFDSHEDSDGGEAIKPMEARAPTKRQAPRTQYSRPSKQPDFKHKDSSYQPSPLELHWDSKMKKANQAAKRRNWHKDEAAEQGGWAQIEHREPDRGNGWQTDANKTVPTWPESSQASVTEELVLPHLRNSQQVRGLAPPVAPAPGNQKYGSLQQNFVAARVLPHEYLPVSVEMSAAAEGGGISAAQGGKELAIEPTSRTGRPSDVRKFGRNKYTTDPPKKPHVDAW